MPHNPHTDRRDHPRIRGEHGDVDVYGDPKTGSSPHTRGAPVAASPSPGISRDHPRIRGEHSDLAASKSTPRGSSPHTRGALSDPGGLRRGARIIPAYAGSTRCSSRVRTSRRDHPRIRGEHRAVGSPVRLARGSSPHTRGAPAVGY